MSLYVYVDEKKLQQADKKESSNRRRIITLQIFAIISITLFIFTSFYKPHASVQKKIIVENTGTVQGVAITSSPTPTPTIVAPTERIYTPEPSPTIAARKDEYTIAIIGDSMVDTMGEKLEYLEHALAKKYPATKFKLFNYGVGSQNVEQGMERFNKPLAYKNRNYPSLPELKPDILIVASFGYNPLSPFDRDAHWLKLAEMIQAGRRISKQVYVLAEIAPLSHDFGKGPHGVNWDQKSREEQAEKINEQLQNAIGLARSLNAPFIDTYHPSIIDGRQEGDKKYVNPDDGIHPSVEGHEFMADKIAETIKLDL